MEKSKKLPLLYIIGMPIILVITSFVASAHFKIGEASLYYSVILFQLVYLILGLIIRKTDYKNALRMMIFSLISITLSFVIQWGLLNIANYWLMIYSFLSMLICQLIFIYAYDFLIKIEKDTYMPVVILLSIVSIIDNMFFGIIIEGQYISVSILVRLICIIATAVFLAKKSK